MAQFKGSKSESMPRFGAGDPKGICVPGRRAIMYSVAEITSNFCASQRIAVRRAGMRKFAMTDKDVTNSEQRPEIERAWHRAVLSGLDPGMEVQARSLSEVDTQTRLAVAARPVLDKLVDELVDTRFAILLADQTARIIDRRVGNRGVGRALDRVLAVPGFQYLEEVSGTNALATAFELRKPIAVTGDEHFLEALKRFACYGAPIIHPITHRVEGVIDISGPVSDATALLGPFLMRATRDIEERLLEGSRVAEKQLLAAFQSITRRRQHAVVAVGESLILTNRAAVDLVDGSDSVALLAIAADMPERSSREEMLVLNSGIEVSVRAKTVDGTKGGVLFELIEKHIPRPTRTSRQSLIEKSRQKPVPEKGVETSRVVLVTGESGTGRTTAAKIIAGKASAAFDASDSIGDEENWFANVRAALLDGEESVLIDDIDVLSPRVAHQLETTMQVSRNPVVMTSLPASQLGGAHRPLTSLAMTRKELIPIRSHPNFVALVKSVVDTLAPHSTIEVAPSVLQILAKQSWPGNIRELRDVLEFAVRGRQRGVVAEQDLPQTLPTKSHARRRLSLIEAAERDAIVSALRASNGNKSAAAAALGIGRTTLYSRLQRYQS